MINQGPGVRSTPVTSMLTFDVVLHVPRFKDRVISWLLPLPSSMKQRSFFCPIECIGREPVYTETKLCLERRSERIRDEPEGEEYSQSIV